MSENYLIGLGGTGAKCVESFMYLAAAGLAPKKFKVKLVDQDSSNGNLERTHELLSVYTRLRRRLRSSDDLGQACNLLKAELLSKTSGQGKRDEVRWVPSEDKRSLREVFRYAVLKPKMRNLIKCFYTEAELDEPLDMGFKGRPYLGAAMMRALLGEQSGFWEGLPVRKGDDSGGEDIRIILVASNFGGVGASGLPLLARMFHDKNKGINAEGGRITLSAVILNPYFTFPPVERKDKDHTWYAEANQFAQEVRNSSLPYYSQLLEAPAYEGRRLFHDIFMIGWSPPISLPRAVPGNRNQENPSLLPEFYAALAVAQYFNNPSGGLHYCSRPLDGALGWEDLPAPHKSLGVGDQKVKSGLSALLRFAFAYLHAWGPHLQREERLKYKDQPWHTNHLSEVLDGWGNSEHGGAEPDDILRDVGWLCERCLEWAASLSYADTNHDGQAHALWDASAFSGRPSDLDYTQVPIDDPLKFNRKKYLGLTATDHYSLEDIFEGMCTPRRQGDEKGLGVFLGQLYRLCAHTGPKTTDDRA